jgi:hypothetical protein
LEGETKGKKWLNYHEKITIMRVIIIKDTRNCLIKIRGKWEKHVNKMETDQIRTRHSKNGVEE